MKLKEQRLLPGGYELKNLFIKPYTSRPNEEIKEIFLEFNIRESLFHPFGFYGSVVMHDAINFMKYSPIIGDEFLNIRFSEHEGESKFKQACITHISDQMPIGENLQGYIINFCSPMAFMNSSNRVCASFKGKKGSEIVEFLYNTYLKERTFGEITPGFFGETSNSMDCIIPNWYPMDAISWVTERCLNEQNNADFFFWESYNGGVNFESLERLLKKDPVGELSYEPSGGSQTPSETANRPNDSTRIYRKFPIRRYKVVQENDSLDNKRNGMYRSKIITHDIVNKTIGGLHDQEKKYRWNYDEDFKKSFHLGDIKGNEGFPLMGDTFDVTQQGYHFENNTSYHFKDPSLFPAQVTENIFPETYFLNRTAILQQFNTWVLEVEILGDSELKVGDIMDFEMPSHEALTGKTVKRPILEMYSGRYIITSIRKSFKQQGLLQTIQLRKNALAKQYSKLDKLAVDGYEIGE